MSQSLPTVSIVTPSFNHGEYLTAAIRSVLEQEYPNLEYFVADGASTDGTIDLLRQFNSEPRLKWVSEPDRGQADAINKGFARTRGEILGWLNSDDTLVPGAIEKIGRYFAEHPDVGLVYGDAQFIDAAGNMIGPCRHIEPFNRHRLLNYSDFIVQPAAFFRRSVFEAVGGLDASLNWAMDYDLWLKLSANAGVEYVPGLLANYRWLGGSKTASGGAARLAEVERMARRHGAKGLPAFFRLEAVRINLADGVAAARRGRIDQTLLCAGKAARIVLSSPRAMGSLVSPAVWRVIWMGQVLRRRGGV